MRTANTMTTIRIRDESLKGLKEIQWEMMSKDKNPDISMADVIDEVVIVYNEYKEMHDKELAKEKIARDKEESAIKTGKKKLKRM